RLSDRAEFWPANVDAVALKEGLEIGEFGGGVADLAGKFFAGEAEVGERAGGFADIPFDRVEAVAAVGDVGRAEVFGGGEEVFHAFGNQRAEGNFERKGADVDVVVAAAGRMEVGPVAADADRIVESGGGDGIFGQSGFGHAGFGANVLFENGEFGLDAAGFADVR